MPALQSHSADHPSNPTFKRLGMTCLRRSALAVLGILVVSVSSAGVAQANTRHRVDVYLTPAAAAGTEVHQSGAFNAALGPDATVLMCWVGDGDLQEPIIHTGNVWLTPTSASIGGFSFGRAGDIPLCVNNEPAVQRGNTFYVVDGSTVKSFRFGRSGDYPISGDWDGDGLDEIAVKRGNTYFFASENVEGGGTVTSSTWGSATDVPLAGDWTGSDIDTLALHRGNTFIIGSGHPGSTLTEARRFQYGRAADYPVAAGPAGSATPPPTIPEYVGVARIS